MRHSITLQSLSSDSIPLDTPENRPIRTRCSQLCSQFIRESCMSKNSSGAGAEVRFRARDPRDGYIDDGGSG